MSEKGEPEGYNISVRYSMYSPSQHLSSLQYVQSVTTSQFATVCTVRHNITVRYSMYSTSQHHSSLQYVQSVTTSQFATVCSVRHNITVSAKIAQLRHFIRDASCISSTTPQHLLRGKELPTFVAEKFKHKRFRSIHFFVAVFVILR